MSGAFQPESRREWPRRSLCDSSGAAAVEFAIVIAPFLALILAILELALDYILFSQVDYLTAKAHVRVRSGEVTLQNMDPKQFKEQHLCPSLTMLPCEPLAVNLITVKVWWDSTGWNNAGAWRPDSVDPSKARFCPGGAADVVFLQVAYPIPFISVFWSGPRSAADGNRYYLSTTAFRNDPFGVPANSQEGC